MRHGDRAASAEGDRLSRALLELYEAGGQDVILDRLLAAITILLPSEYHACTEVNYRTGTVRGPLSPKEEFEREFGTIEEGNALMGRHIHENPIAGYVHRTGEWRALRMSDFLSRPQLHDLGLYQEVYRPMRIEHVLALTFRPEPEIVLGLAATRKGRAYSDAERDRLEQLTPHVRQAYRNAARFTQLERAGRLSLERVEEAAAHLGLTRRQAEVMFAMLGASNNATAASALGVSPLTVKKHLENIYRVLGVGGRMEAVQRILNAVPSGNGAAEIESRS